MYWSSYVYSSFHCLCLICSDATLINGKWTGGLAGTEMKEKHRIYLLSSGFGHFL